MKKLYVGNLSFETTEDDLQRVFEQCGEVAGVQIMYDRDTQRSQGFGFVEMSDNDAAEQAVVDLNGTEIGGRSIQVDEARSRAPRRA
ncbi:RNA-binding protein [Streptomyces sp. ME19-01-6]|uniref:RNA recognition motif domain-containing protein n=1 Tax=Streptomyces sp. ME19-01-6 TaxID=3028686 RepID=UPI0029BC9DFF|nr:RNA-binding protein [Streptomyces sp. ME19-01-6]MDX3227186.1 RNA-binding protein [Streptomyces sp. ME19-01-6]